MAQISEGDKMETTEQERQDLTRELAETRQEIANIKATIARLQREKEVLSAETRVLDDVIQKFIDKVFDR
jgi:septal ring factor EnvC (AmiA/AmiB activator)